jgi:hypothetical protein
VQARAPKNARVGERAGICATEVSFAQRKGHFHGGLHNLLEQPVLAFGNSSTIGADSIIPSNVAQETSVQNMPARLLSLGCAYYGLSLGCAYYGCCYFSAHG